MSLKASAEGVALEDCIVNPQHRLYFLPLLHGQGEFRPNFDIYFTSKTNHLKTFPSTIVIWWHKGHSYTHGRSGNAIAK